MRKSWQPPVKVFKHQVDSKALQWTTQFWYCPWQISINILPSFFPTQGKKDKRNNFRITPLTTEMILITNSSVGRLFWQMYLQLGKITNEPIPYSRVDADSACWICSQKRVLGNNTSGALLEEFVMSLTCSASIVHTTLTAGPLYFKEIAVWINIIRM